MDIVAIQNRLMDAGVFISISNLEDLIAKISKAKRDGNLVDVDGYYSPHAFIKHILGRSSNTWARITSKNRDIWKYCSNPSPAATAYKKFGNISAFGLLYLGAFCKYESEDNKSANRVINKTKVPQIYILRDKGNQALKVGFSFNLQERVLKITGIHPFVVTIAVFDVTNITTEKRLHRELDAYRFGFATEWYPDVAEVRDRINKFMVNNGFADELNQSLAADPYKTQG